MCVGSFCRLSAMSQRVFACCSGLKFEILRRPFMGLGIVPAFKILEQENILLRIHKTALDVQESEIKGIKLLTKLWIAITGETPSP